MAALTLESLPVELQIQVLEEIPDVSSLQCLIHASPAYRATYSRTRKTILHQLVARAYGLVGVEDAIAAVDSDNLHAEVEANKSAIIALLDRRRRHTDFRRSRLPSESQSIRLLQLYNKLSPVLAACRPPHVSRESWSGDSCLVQRGRVLRALCRLQTYSNIFGAREWTGTDGLGLNPEQGTTWHRHFTIDEMWSLFFRTMPPWEVEEFGSVWTFMRQMYTDFFASISKDFPRNSPEWRELRPATMPIDPSELYGSEDADEYENTEYDDYCNHLVALGPGFLSKVLCQPECARRQLLASNAVTAKSSFMDLVSVVTSHEPLIYPADRYENTPNHLATLPEIEQPGVGWKQHWFGDRPVDQVMRATNPDLFPDRTIGFFPGWTWGYAIRS